MFSRKKMVAVAVLAVLSKGAFADASVAEKIKTINEDVAVLSARLSEMEVRAKIAGKQQEIDRLGGTGDPSSSKELPVVRAIEGSGGRMMAILAIGGGTTQTVVKGDTIGEWTVNKIDVNSVVLARGKQVVRLGFGSEPPLAPQTAQGGTPHAGYPGVR